MRIADDHAAIHTRLRALQAEKQRCGAADQIAARTGKAAAGPNAGCRAEPEIIDNGDAHIVIPRLTGLG